MNLIILLLKLMKKLLLILCLFSMTANATVEDGNSFLEHIDSKDSIRKQYLIGYVSGMYDAFERTDISISNCLGKVVKMSQLVDSLEIYLRNNPQMRHYPMTSIFPEAIKKQFNCKK